MYAVVGLFPKFWAFGDADDVDSGRNDWIGLGADRPDLFHLALDLDEAEPVGEGQRAFVLDTGRGLGVSTALTVSRQGGQDGRADAATPELGDHPSGHEGSAEPEIVGDT
jgi:hypothetical protein